MALGALKILVFLAKAPAGWGAAYVDLPLAERVENAITRYIDARNSDCRPFTWTTSAKAIFEKLAQIPVSSV
jgi:hypothetical protein